jgi:ABC-type uncharacterized transport system substrate-binding protein
MALIGVGVYASAAVSHPHVFIENTVHVLFDATGMVGVRLHWTLDEMFSAAITADCDKDRDGVLSPAEKQNIQKTYFNNLREYNYFCHITANGAPVPIGQAQDFEVALHNGRISYTFFLACRVPASAQDKTVVIAVYDNTYYCDVLLVDYRCQPELVLKGFRHTSTSVQNTADKFYFGQIAPDEIIVTFRKAS